MSPELLEGYKIALSIATSDLDDSKLKAKAGTELHRFLSIIEKEGDIEKRQIDAYSAKLSGIITS